MINYVHNPYLKHLKKSPFLIFLDFGIFHSISVSLGFNFFFSTAKSSSCWLVLFFDSVVQKSKRIFLYISLLKQLCEEVEFWKFFNLYSEHNFYFTAIFHLCLLNSSTNWKPPNTYLHFYLGSKSFSFFIMSATGNALEGCMGVSSIELEHQALNITVPSDYIEPVSSQSSPADISQNTTLFPEA